MLFHLQFSFWFSIPQQSGDSVTQLNIASQLRSQAIKPSVSLTQLVQTIRPSKATILPLTSSRDQSPEGALIYSALIEYTFKMVRTLLNAIMFVGIQWSDFCKSIAVTSIHCYQYCSSRMFSLSNMSPVHCIRVLWNSFFYMYAKT